MGKNIKLVVFVPSEHADVVRRALADSGAGALGDYHGASYSMKVVSRFVPEEAADPAIGTVGEEQLVEEERIEVIVEREKAKAAIEKMKAVHPYEEVPFDIIPLLDEEEL